VVSGGARRLDWHVLLPERRQAASGHWLLLGAERDLPRLAVELGLAGSASSVADRRQPADVVGLLHTADTSIDDAIQTLAPGGYLYWEVDRRSARTVATTPGRARRRVRAAGLVPCGVYLIGGGWSRPGRFLPVDSDEPIRWSLAASGLSAGRLRRLLGRILRGPGLVARMAGLLVPRFVVIAGSDESDGAPAVLRHPEVPASIRSSTTPPIVITGGQEPWARITLLAFPAGGLEPSLILKVSRQPEYDEATRGEHAVLLALRGQLDEATRSTVPEAVSLVEIGRRPVAVQSVVRGSSALARMRRRRDRTSAWRDLDLTAEWLISLQLQTLRSRVAPGSAGWIEHVDEPLARFTDAFGERAEVERLFRDLRAQATASAADLAIVQCHRDLGPWNVLVEGDAVRVIDWEVARDGPAMTDLVYASVHWAFEAKGMTNEADRRQELRRLFSGRDDADAATASIRTAIRRSIEVLRVDPRLVAPLVVLTMVGQALDRFDRLARIGRADPQPWLGNRYVGYVAELAAIEDGWISDPTRLVGRA
jgi:phosphotransferase family enzyme